MLPNGKTDWSTFFTAGVALGFPPSEINNMTRWEFECCVNAWIRTHNPKKPTASKDLLEALGLDDDDDDETG